MTKRRVPGGSMLSLGMLLLAVPAAAQQSTEPPAAAQEPTKPAEPTEPTEPTAAADSEPAAEPAPASASEASVAAAPDASTAESDAPRVRRKRNLFRRKHEIEFVTTQPGVTFHYAKASGENERAVPETWVRLCQGECVFELAPGRYRFALSHGASEPVMAPSVFEVDGGHRFEGGYTDRSHVRLAGMLVLGLGTVSAATTLTLGGMLLREENSNDNDLGRATIASGVAGLLLSLMIGIPLAVTSDVSQVAAAD